VGVGAEALVPVRSEGTAAVSSTGTAGMAVEHARLDVPAAEIALAAP